MIETTLTGPSGQTTKVSPTTDQASPDYETTVTVSNPYVARVAAIRSEAGSVRFIRGSHARRDKPGEYALTAVEVYNRANRLVKRFSFGYDYFGPAATTNAQALRLKLTYVREQATGCAAVTTRFDYKDMISAYRRDYWGYFTVPAPPRSDPFALTPNADAMQSCILYRISSSTGSSTTLEYEPHVDKLGTTLGGLRVKKITVYDGYRSSANQVFEVGYTVFDRMNPGLVGGPSSEIVLPPRYQEFQEIRQQGSSLCNSSDDIVSKYWYSSSEPLQPISPDYVGYKWAQIKFPNGSRSVFKFTNQADYGDTYDYASTKLSTNPYAKDEPCHGRQVNIPAESTLGCGQGDPRSPQNRGTYAPLYPGERSYGILSSAAHRRGILLEQVDLDSENRPVTLVENAYDFSQRDVVLRSAVVGKEQEVFAYEIFNYYYNIKFYQLERAWIPLQQQLVTSYDQRRGNSLAIAQSQQLTKYGYANFMVANMVVSNPAEGKEYKTVLTRVADYAPSPYTTNPTFLPGIGELYYGGSLATIVGTDQFIKPSATGAWQHIFQTEKEYFAHNGKPLLRRTMSYDYVAGGTQPTGQANVAAVEYDEQGNLTNVLSTAGLYGGTIWGYNRLLPIASVVNGRVSTPGSGSTGIVTAGHTSFENPDDDGWSTGTVVTTEAKTGQQSIQLSAPNSIYGPGKVFTLTPADKHGKYIFSCWAKVPKNEGGQSNVTLVTVINTPNGGSIWRGTGTVISANQEWQLCRGILDLDESAIQTALSGTQNVTVQCYPWISWGSGNVLLDEFRFHAENARMTTTTYESFVGKTSITDENQVTTYFLYDASNELRLVKDAKGNIVKRLKSHVASTPDLTVQVAKTAGNLHPRGAVTFTASVPECVDGVTYTWNFGDGTTQKGGAEQSHTYAQPGAYALTVVAEAADANPVEATRTFQVTDPITVWASYYGTTYYDLCDPYGGERSASITAQPGAGCGGYTYRWQTSEYQQWGNYWTDWADAGNTSDTYAYYHNSPRNLQVRCIVTDACGNTAELYDGFYTYYSDPNCGTAVQYLQAPSSTSLK
ncbi:hypothetical protein GCM10011378_39890 [Hymenobacter glacieicola]|uniref:PKD domain-containing protein n=2 Tax=Hymenobacter glacieicola TaxID=1562124 RepID=A0ABQ1X4R6_9BACT|nr:hypothetical protein GCM10011378_39890 [Hymenobacter glacieicola]